MKDCRKCKSYKDCVGKEWYSYTEIRFCPFQILWMIEYCESDKWPPNPEGSNYTDPGIRTGYASEGYFVKPAGIRGEVEARLKRCGVDGKLLKAEVLAGLELSPESKSALHYCKGWRRKAISYQRWKGQCRYRSNLSIKMSSKFRT